MRNFDYGKLKEIKWDKEILNYIGKIHEYKGGQQLFLNQKPDELKKLVEMAKIQSTEASNEIEGIITTNSRLKQLMADKTTPRNRDENEILGYRNVLKIIHENFEYIPISSNYILQFHQELYRFSDSGIGGRFKNSPNEIDEIRRDGTKVVRFRPLAPFETPGAMEQICDNYNKIIESYEVDPLIVIPTFIQDFLCIHPFNDGNGRMSRLLTTLLLYKSGFVVGKYISIEKKVQQTKNEYYDALQSSSVDWHDERNNNEPFQKYLLGIILACYRDFEDRINLVSSKKSSYELVKDAIKLKIGKFTKSDIMELCPSIGRASIENALKKLVEEKKVIIHGSGRSTFYTRTN